MSPANVSARSAHLAESSQIEAKLKARHVNFTFEPNLPVNSIREAEGNQVRLSMHRAPKEMVDRYAEQMRGGATFPAIVVNDRYEMVDGNTRWMATRRNKKDTIPAYVCADLSALDARSLSVELNQSHGLSMTEEELRAFVRSAVREGQTLDAKAYARMTGVKASTLGRWVASTQFEIRAHRENLPAEPLALLSDTVRRTLQAARLRSVFRAAAALAIDARTPAAELKSIIAEANAAPSENDALSVVTHAREARAEIITAVASGFKQAKRRSSGSALYLGGLLKYEVDDLLDVPAERHREMFDRLSRLRVRLEAVLAKAQTEWNLSAGDPSVSATDLLAEAR